MKVAFNRSSEWLNAEKIRLGRNLNRTASVEIDPATLSEESRATIIAAHREYPDCLRSVRPYDWYGTSPTEFAADMHPEDVTPGHVDQMIAVAAASDAAKRAALEAEKEELRLASEAKERAQAAEFASQNPVIDAFLADPDARPTEIGTRPRYWIQLGDTRVSKDHPRFDALAAEMNRRIDADVAAKEQEQVDRKQRLADQIAVWVSQHGTDSQRARLAEGLLPNAEVVDAIKTELLAPGRDFATYSKITAQEVRAECDSDNCYDDDGGKVEFEVEDAATLTEDQFESLRALRAAFPNAEVTPRIHVGTWDCGGDDCQTHHVTRLSARVHVACGEIHAVAEYAI